MIFEEKYSIHLSFIIAFIGSLLAYLLIGQPPFIGIDDANITQAYAKNLSAGYGYVYTPGYERVEGSTSILWTFINAAAFSISSHPELIILVISFLLTTGSIYFVLLLFRHLSDHSNFTPNLRQAVISCALVGMPGFYAWNVLSLMDIALWTFLLNGMLLVFLFRITERISGRLTCVAITALAILLNLTRPEAMALVPVLIIIGAISDWQSTQTLRETIGIFSPGLLGSALTTGSLAYVRNLYFGVPFPNTYYALVSSNPIDNLKNGVGYLANFSIHEPFADLLILLVYACVIVSVGKLYFFDAEHDICHVYRSLFVVSAAALAVLLLPFATGGDHFGSFRVYQPIYPILLCVMCTVFLAILNRYSIVFRSPRWIEPFLIVGIASGILSFAMANFLKNQDFGDQIRIAQTGRVLGDALNKITLPSFDTRVAVTAAGGIAMTYKGRIIDLLGLNWPKMAHAKGRRTGTPGHSAFVSKIFWDEMPELVLPSISDTIPPNVGVRDYISKFLDGLTESRQFKNKYIPVAIPVSNRYIVVFARRDWVNNYLKVGKLIQI